MKTAIHRNVIFNWVGLGVRIVVGFALLPYVVGKLGTTGYGQYLFVIAIFGYSEILDFGFRAAILRYVARLSARADYDQLNVILGAVFKYYAAIALLVLMLGIGAFVFPQPHLMPEDASVQFPLYLLVLAGASAARLFRLGWQSVLWARERYDLANGVELSVFLLRSSFIVVLLARGHGVITLVLADLLENLLCFVLHRFIVARRFPEIRPRWRGSSREDLRAITNYSLWVFLNGLSAQLRFRAPNLVIGWTLTAGDVTLFGVAGRIQSYLFQISTAMNAPFRSRMSALEGTDDWPAIRDLLLRATQLITMLALTCTGILFVFGDRFLNAWVGDELGAQVVLSIHALRILLPALAMEMALLASTSALYAVGRHQWLSAIVLGEAVCIVGLGVGLVHEFGIVGVAIGTAAPVVFNKLAVQSVYACRTLGVGYLRFLRGGVLGPVLATCVAIPVLYLLKWSWPATDLVSVFVQMTVSLAPFAAGAWLLALDPRDRLRVRGIVGRAWLAVRRQRGDGGPA